MKHSGVRARTVGLLAVAAGLIVAVLALPVGTAHATTTTKPLDRQCKTTASGTACVEVSQVTSGSKVSRKGRMIITPAKGHWMQLVNYDEAGIEMGGGGPYCEDGSCAHHTKPWTTKWRSFNDKFVYVSTYNTDAKSSKNGAYQVTAGDTGNWLLATKCADDPQGKVCVRLYQRDKSGQGTLTAQLSVAPNSKGKITPRSVTVSVTPEGHKAVTKTADLCAKSCTARTAAWHGSVTMDAPDTTVAWTSMKASGSYSTAAKHTLTATF